MLVICLKRIGKKHQAAYRVVVKEKRSKLGGRFIEDLGFYNPHTKKAGLKKERIEYWFKVGAHPSETVQSLIKKEKIKL